MGKRILRCRIFPISSVCCVLLLTSCGMRVRWRLSIGASSLANDISSEIEHQKVLKC